MNIPSGQLARLIQAQHEVATVGDRGGNEQAALESVRRLPQGAISQLLNGSEPIDRIVARSSSRGGPIGALSRGLGLPYSGPWGHVRDVVGPPILIPGGRRPLRGPQYR